MRYETRISPVNSVIFISDIEGGKTPLPAWGVKVAATSSCIFLAVYPEQDGPTSITLGDVRDVLPETHEIFDGWLDTPHGILMIQTVDDIRVLQMAVGDARIRARIWVDDTNWPSRVVIGVG